MLNKGTLFTAKKPEGAAGTVVRSLAPSTVLTGGAAANAVSAGREAAEAVKPIPGDVTPLAENIGAATLVVGPGVKLKGAEIQDCDALIVQGRVEATMDSRLIEIAEHGAFEGKVNIDVAEIRGSFQGELTAREQIIVHASGRVSGKIRYGRIVVHEGGEISGDIRSLTAAETPAAVTPANLDSSGMGKILSGFPTAAQRSGTDQ